MEQNKDQINYITKEQLRRLREISDYLHAGSDGERDIGHRIWLILSEVEGYQSVDLYALVS